MRAASSTSSVGGQAHRRGDACGVAHLVGVHRPARARETRHLRLSGDETGPDHHGEAQPVLAGVVAQALLVGDLHRHLLARRDVGHRGGEDVGTLLFDKAGLAALRLGFLVGALGRLALLDLALDDPAGNQQAQAVDRGVLGQREDVDAFLPGLPRIAEALAHLDPGDHAADAYPDVGRQYRRRQEEVLTLAAEEKTAAPDLGEADAVGRLLGNRAGRGRPMRREQDRKERENSEEGVGNSGRGASGGESDGFHPSSPFLASEASKARAGRGALGNE
jgi:hypothetical protein